MQPNVPGGFVAELRKVLSSFFAGDQWDERQQHTFEILFRLLGHLSRIDGTESPRERVIAGEVMSELGLPPELRERAIAAFDGESDGAVDVRRELRRYLEVFPADSPQITTLLDCVTRLVLADGDIDPAERAFLDELNRTLGITDHDQRLEALARMPMH